MGSTLNKNVVPEMRKRLLRWFGQEQRELPWRATRDPYCVWVSEIMLQQTRVAAVIDHYGRFLKRFPRVENLAAAREASVLAIWSGLGYYRRARNLHAAAKVVVKEYGGEFPRTSAGLLTLPGVGRYTAAAIASIAFGEPVAVVDGNVERVISRITGTGVSGEKLWERAGEMLSVEHPGDFNQAMMELGATVCLPGEPKCSTCPVRRFCRTQGRHHARPKSARQAKREIGCGLEIAGGSVLLVQRSENEKLMPGMWELPPISLHSSHKPLFAVRHSITVTDYTVRVLRGEGLSGTWIKNSRLRTLALTGLTKKILKRAGVIQSGAR
jgi:A/G-specific adenine glycosylase